MTDTTLIFVYFPPLYYNNGSYPIKFIHFVWLTKNTLNIEVYVLSSTENIQISWVWMHDRVQYDVALITIMSKQLKNKTKADWDIKSPIEHWIIYHILTSTRLWMDVRLEVSLLKRGHWIHGFEWKYKIFGSITNKMLQSIARIKIYNKSSVWV